MAEELRLVLDFFGPRFLPNYETLGSCDLQRELRELASEEIVLGAERVEMGEVYANLKHFANMDEKLFCNVHATLKQQLLQKKQQLIEELNEFRGRCCLGWLGNNSKG